MTGTQMNIINRWSKMAFVDLGTDVNSISRDAVSFFERVFNGAEQITENIKSLLPLLRGFEAEYSNIYNITTTETLDLEMVTIDKEAAIEFDYWLMEEQNWKMRYEYSLNH